MSVPANLIWHEAASSSALADLLADWVAARLAGAIAARGTAFLAVSGGTTPKLFFQALSQHAGITLHVTNHYGANSHHIAETCFKAVARCLRAACEIDPRQAGAIPSTKGSLKG